MQMHINRGANCKKLLQFGEITNFWLTVLSYIRSLSANLRFSGVVFFKFSWWPKYWEATWQLLKNYLKLRFGDWLFKLLWSFKKRHSGVRPWTDSIFKETLPSATIWRPKSWPVLTLRYHMDNGQAEKVFLLPQCVM